MTEYPVESIDYVIPVFCEWYGSPMTKIQFGEPETLSGRKLSVEEITNRVIKRPARKSVFTKTESLGVKTQPLAVAVRKLGIKTHVIIDSSATTHGDWDWVTVVFRPGTIPNTHTVFIGSEFVFICGPPEWENFTIKTMKDFGFDLYHPLPPFVWLVPECGHVHDAIEFCGRNPRVRFGGVMKWNVIAKNVD